jgi:hypothetical protein
VDITGTVEFSKKVEAALALSAVVTVRIALEDASQLQLSTGRGPGIRKNENGKT